MGKMSGSHCLVMGCRNRQLLNQTNTRSYFRFPRDPEMCKQWVNFCNRPELWKKYEENGSDYLYKSSRICSDHFEPSDFNNPNLFSQGLKKGSVPTQYPASKEPKNRFSLGGSGSSNGIGGNSPPSITNTVNGHESLLIPLATKRPMVSQPSATQQPVAKQARRSLPTTLSAFMPTAVAANAITNAAAVSGALAGLIQRQQLKEQQRKAFAAALQLQHKHQQQQQQQTNPRSLLSSLKLKANNNNNNNNNVSNNNNNHINGKSNQERLEDERGYGINYVDMDGGDSSEHDSSYQNSVDEDLAMYKQLQLMKAAKAAAAVIPAALKGELTVTPAVKRTSNSSPIGSSNTTNSNIINNNNNDNNSTNNNNINGAINYKEKYEQTLKELFACRKIVKNQNNAIKQLQGEIDFLNQLLKEK